MHQRTPTSTHCWYCSTPLGTTPPDLLQRMLTLPMVNIIDLNSNFYYIIWRCKTILLYINVLLILKMQFIVCFPGQNVKIRRNQSSEIKQVILSRIVYGLLKFSSSKFLLFFELIVNQTKNTKLERSGGQCSQNFLVHQVRALNQRKLRATNILVLQKVPSEGS